MSQVPNILLTDLKDYDLNLNHVLYQQQCGRLKITGIISKYKNWQTIDYFRCINSSNIKEVEYDYVIVMDLDNFSKVSIDISRELNIPRDKIISISPFREPFFDFSEYVKILSNPPTIICDNCFGGIAYHFLGLRFSSPIINMFLESKSVIKIYRNVELLTRDLSLYKKEKNGFRGQDYPIAKTKDGLKLFMNHYNDFNNAYDLWRKRFDRINANNYVFVIQAIDEKQLSEIDRMCEDSDKNVIATSNLYKSSEKMMYVDEWDYDKQMIKGQCFWRVHNRCADYKFIHSTPFLLTKKLLGKKSDRRTYYHRYLSEDDIDYKVQCAMAHSGDEIRAIINSKKHTPSIIC